jgi:hypothetical protein
MCELGTTFVQLESLEHSQFVAENKLNGSKVSKGRFQTEVL